MQSGRDGTLILITYLDVEIVGIYAMGLRHGTIADAYCFMLQQNSNFQLRAPKNSLNTWTWFKTLKTLYQTNKIQEIPHGS